MSGPDSEEHPDLDVLYELLASQRRRHVLRVLYEADAVMGVSQLAERIAGIEADDEERPQASRKTVRPRAVERVTAGLVHVDLPKLAAAGLVRYDSDQQTVEATADVEPLVPLLDPFEDD